MTTKELRFHNNSEFRQLHKNRKRRELLLRRTDKYNKRK